MRDPLDSRLQTMRIIVAALIAGLCLFAGLAIFLRQQDGGRPVVDPPVLTYVAIPLALGGLIAAISVPSMILRSARPAPNVSEDGPPVLRWVDAYQTALIVGCSFLEGPAFFLLIAYLLEGNPLGLGLALGLVLVLASRMPTRAGVEAWAERMERA